MEVNKHKLIPFLSKNKIQEVCSTLGKKITKDYKDKVQKEIQIKEPEIIALCILKGGLFFVADILRQIKIPFIIDFVKLSSYGSETKSKGTVSILQDISVNIKNKHVIIFDEIVDSGRTLLFYINRLKASKPASIKICTLINKKDCRAKGIKLKPDYIGVEAGHEFLVGYGLDFGERYRNIPDIYKLEFLN
jgi:hypoxanthine phosphoribosyltransferase